MMKNILNTLYLTTFYVVFSLFKVFPQKNKAVFVISFGENALFTIKELEKQVKDEVVILKTSKAIVNFYDVPKRKILRFELLNIMQWFQSIYHLATSTKVFADDYFDFLYVTNFKKGTKCIQLWHAAGSFKKFSHNHLINQNHTSAISKRIKKVYQRFDHVIVGSPNMEAIFKRGFGINDGQVLRTGVPRLDFFFNEIERKHAEQIIHREYPVPSNKKVILYAPTYRDDELNISRLKLNINEMYKELKFDYVLFLRLHPAIDGTFENKFPGFVYNVSDYPNIQHIMTVTDILVTDYSSLPFEFSLLQKPIIFYAYDLDKYAESRGFWGDYEGIVPGPIARNTDELIDTIKENKFDLNKVQKFAKAWNKYSTGNASKKLIKTLYNIPTKKRPVIDTKTGPTKLDEG